MTQLWFLGSQLQWQMCVGQLLDKHADLFRKKDLGGCILRGSAHS